MHAKSYAVAVLNKNSKLASQGRCARYIRWALEGGGLNTRGNPVSAADYVDFLINRGFSEINPPNYNPQAGDVVAIKANFSDATGHVAIMISPTKSIGAGHSEVHVTDFGSNTSHFSDFPGNNGYVYRRYVGGSTSSPIPSTYVNPAYKQYP